MARKPRILAWCDTPTVTTGFGNVAKNLLRDAHKEFDIDIVGINYWGTKKYDTDKWFIYSTGHNMDQMGYKVLPLAMESSKPDLVFLFQDLFAIDLAYPLIRKVDKDTPVVIYFPIDGGPFSRTWGNVLEDKGIKKIFTYSEFANREILKVVPDLNKELEIMYHGVDVDTFKLLPKEEVDEFNRSRGWDGRFVMMNLNKFQPRKNIMNTVLVGSLLVHGYKKCRCGHYYLSKYDTCDLNGCGQEDVIEEVKPKRDITLYMHMNIMERIMGPLRSCGLSAIALNTGWTDADIDKYGTLALLDPERNLVSNPFSEEELNMLYNAISVNITTTLGEGCGLSLLESAATGTTSIAPNHSAIPEQIGDTGHLVKNAAYFSMHNDNSHMRPIVSVPAMVDAVEIEYKKWLDNGREKIINYAAIERVHEKFLWDDKREQLMSAFRELTKDVNNEKE